MEEVFHNPIAGKFGLLSAFASSLKAPREQLPQLSLLDLACAPVMKPGHW